MKSKEEITIELEGLRSYVDGAESIDDTRRAVIGEHISDIESAIEEPVLDAINHPIDALRNLLDDWEVNHPEGLATFHRVCSILGRMGL